MNSERIKRLIAEQRQQYSYDYGIHYINLSRCKKHIFCQVNHFPAVTHSHRFSSFTVMLRSRKPTFVRWCRISSGV